MNGIKATSLIANLPAKLASLELTSEQAFAIGSFNTIINLHPAARPNVLVRARAGAAKTTMLCLIASMLPRPQAFHDGPVFLAFNKAIASELESRLPSSCRASTFHSLGYSILRTRFRSKTNTEKYRAIFEEVIGDCEYELRLAAMRVVDRARNAALTPEEAGASFEDLAGELDLLPEDLPSDFNGDTLSRILHKGMSNPYEVDFTDMLWLPVVLGLKSKPANFILVDESQDTNKVQIGLLRLFGSDETCYVFVGDDRQAIYGFRGAFTDALHRITSEFAIEPENVIPLSTTFRCPQAVVAEAQLLVPDIQAKIGAPFGKVLTSYLPFLDFPRDSLIVCRNNRPLARTAMQLLKARQPFHVLSDFFPRLKKFVEARAKHSDSTAKLQNALLLWQDEQIAKLPEHRHEAILERTSTLIAIIDELGEGATVKQVVSCLNDICNSMGGVKLATIHKSKGLEAEHVFFLCPELVPSKYATTPEAYTQEMNLKYVAITRAKQTLVYWSPSDKGEPMSASDFIAGQA